MKNRKAAGLDQLSNEMIKAFGSLYTEFLSKLFSKILHEHKFPTLWITGLLLPVHKKGPKSLVKNYRGIMLLSCLGKLFTAILNERLITLELFYLIMTVIHKIILSMMTQILSSMYQFQKMKKN